jgi:hypothetical protein
MNDKRTGAARDEKQQTAESQLLRSRQIEALKAAAGCWKDSDHPELKQGSAKWVRKLRQENERRFKRSAARRGAMPRTSRAI